MALSTQLRSLHREIDQLGDEFGHVEILSDSDDLLIVSLTLRGVDVRIIVDPRHYPDSPPALHTDGGWEHPNVGSDGHVRGLECQAEWNRTLGIGQAIRELYRRFLNEPPDRRASGAA